MVSIDRLFKILEIPQENKVPEIPTQVFKIQNQDWPSQGKLEFRDVELRYRPTTELVLKGLSFTVEPGEKVGIVGRTGAGKSTICLSISRIVELFGGQILLDGQDIAKLDLAYVRSKITVIPQDAAMFQGTLRFNLDPFNEVPDVEIMRLLKEAGLDDLIKRGGVDLKIEENGSNLSSGEKQLLCICRAILRKSKLVVLDEATANIDIVTEQKIQKLIKLEFKEATMLVIAHRLNTILHSDKVLVLSYGKVVEYDSPENLQNDKNSEFSKLLQELEKENKA